MIYVLSCLVWGSIYLALNSSQAYMWGRNASTQYLGFKTVCMPMCICVGVSVCACTLLHQREISEVISQEFNAPIH